MSVDETASPVDGLLGGRIRLAQPAQGYRVAIDPVFLAASIAAAPGQIVLDAGCGSGAAALCLAARLSNCRVVGVERDEALAGFARRNARENGLDDRFAVVEQDFAVYAPAHRDAFDQVMLNPPFNARAAHTASPYDTKAAAHRETGLDLDDWVVAATTCLKPGGSLTLIHRADRIADVLASLGRRFGAALIFPLWPRMGVPAKRIIVSAVKGRKTLPRLLPGLVLHDDGGPFTLAAEGILRDAAPLILEPLALPDATA